MKLREDKIDLKPLKALRSRIKRFKQQQYDDLYNQYKNKGKEQAGKNNDAERENSVESKEELPIVEEEAAPLKEDEEELKKRMMNVPPHLRFKGMKKFDKMLTAKKLMLADIMNGDKDDKDYKEKVACCFEMRVNRLKKRQLSENNKWSKVVNSE